MVVAQIVDKLLGMQLIVESVAVTLFRSVAQAGVEPVLSELLPYFERDEARHVGLGVLYLPARWARIAAAAGLGRAQRSRCAACRAHPRVRRATPSPLHEPRSGRFHAGRPATEHLRTRGLWEKGATSGNVMEVVEVRLDCDQDAILLRVKPAGPACHTGAESCFYQPEE